jgi:hypothetical protein
MIELRVIKGTSASWEIQGRNRLSGTVPVAFDASVPISARAWPGDDQAVLLEPAAAWTDAPACKVRISVVDADTADVEPGVYRCQVVAELAGRAVPIAEAAFVVLAAPGTAVAPKVYCTAGDLHRECTWIGQFLNVGEDQAGFAEQRAEAREWFDDLILAGRPSTGYSQRFPGVLTWGRGGLLADPWLTAILAGGGLMLTGPRGRKAVRANAYYALSRILGTMIGPGDKLAAQGRLYAVRAANAVKSMVVELDADGDGVADLAVPLCVTYTLRG